MLLDEPGAGLDPWTRQSLFEHLLAWQQQGKKTMVIASHDMDEIYSFTEHVFVMAAGRIVLSGATKTILSDSNIEQYHLRRGTLTLPSPASG
jgi:energy-coupling factor transporter ATP-binding protein EcfA2